MRRPLLRERCIAPPAQGSMAAARAHPPGACAPACPCGTGRPHRQGARVSLSWWLTTVCLQRKPLRSGGHARRVWRCAGCRRPVRGPSPLSGPVAMGTTNGPGTPNGNVCAMWGKTESSLGVTTARGRTTSPRCIRPPRSRPLSSTGLVRHKPNSPRECTNLVWADLGLAPPLSPSS